MSTAFQPIEIPPGVVSTATKKMRSSNWSEVNAIRWREGQLQPMGGQAQFKNSGFTITINSSGSGWSPGDLTITMSSANPSTVRPSMAVFSGSIQIGVVQSYIGTTLTLTSGSSFGGAPSSPLTFSGGNYFFNSRCKMIHSWHGLDGTTYIAYLCESNLYVDVGGALYDITPIGGIVAPSGLVGGYGDGPYNDGTYGTPRSIPGSVAITKIPDAYSLDNFGTIIYAMTSADSRLLMWNPDVGPPGPVFAGSIDTTGSFAVGATTIPMSGANPGSIKPGMSVYNFATGAFIGVVLTYIGSSLVLAAPGAAIGSGGLSMSLAFANAAVMQPAASGRGPVPHGRAFVVTPDRFIMIFGSTQDGTTGGGSSRRTAWCDQENPSAWDYASQTSQAGFFDLEPASPIICGLASRLGILVWTAQKVYASKFLGLPYVYNFTELADGTTPWSPQSMVTTSSLSLWMSEQGVFSYDGTSVLPVQCLIRPWIDDDFDPILVREFAFAAHLAEFNEWWWFFPQSGAGQNSRAAVYNYKEGWWTQVRMTRSAGITSNYTSHPIFADNTIAFQHEVGVVYVNADLPFAETFDLNLTSGARLTTIKQMMPDIEGDIANLRYSIFYRNSRSLGLPEMQTLPRAVRPDGYVDFRTTGRDVRIRIDVATPIVENFTVGQHLIDAVPRGDR